MKLLVLVPEEKHTNGTIRSMKLDRREGDEKSRAECRKDKRGAKQDAREGARDARRGE